MDETQRIISYLVESPERTETALWAISWCYDDAYKHALRWYDGDEGRAQKYAKEHQYEELCFQLDKYGPEVSKTGDSKEPCYFPDRPDFDIFLSKADKVNWQRVEDALIGEKFQEYTNS